MTLEASVIIPTYDDWPVLQLCLDCLANQSVALDRFEVIVANNNASPDPPASLRLPPNAHLIHVPKPGSYAARNAALRLAKGDALFFTDSDCLPDRQWIESGLSALVDLAPIDRIAGAVELFPKGEAWTGPELYDRILSLQQATYAQQGWCATANLVTRRAAFDLVGPFDEDAFSGGDGVWGFRAKALGSRIVFSQPTSVRHPARPDFAQLAKRKRRLIGNRHHREVVRGTGKSLIASYLLPEPGELATIARYDGLSEADKLEVMWIHYRLRLVSLVELFRLRYLSGTPQRS
jgi:glycosyltransferase involved in cell wall biosynthesis